jgi:hypothetical protein
MRNVRVNDKKKKKKTHGKEWASLPIYEMLKGGIPWDKGLKKKKLYQD